MEKINLADNCGKFLKGSWVSLKIHLEQLCKFPVVMKILNKSKCSIAQSVSIFMKQLYSLANLWPHISVTGMKNKSIIYWSQKGNKVTRNDITKYSVSDIKVLPTCFFPQSYSRESHYNLKTVKGKSWKMTGAAEIHTLGRAAASKKTNLLPLH